MSLSCLVFNNIITYKLFVKKIKRACDPDHIPLPNYFALERGAKHCDRHVCLSVCMSVSFCLSARISQKPHVHTSRNFLYVPVLHVAVTWSSADDNVALFSSGFLDDAMFSQNQRPCYVVEFARWRHRH